MRCRVAFRLASFSATLLVLASISQRCSAEDTLIIHVRDLEGIPVENAFVKVFQQKTLGRDDGLPVVARISPVGGLTTSDNVRLDVALGDSVILGNVVEKPLAIFTLKVDATDPANRSLVIVAGRLSNKDSNGVPISTAVIPFVIDAYKKGKEGALLDDTVTHELYIAVPATPRAPSKELPIAQPPLPGKGSPSYGQVAPPRPTVPQLVVVTRVVQTSHSPQSGLQVKVAE